MSKIFIVLTNITNCILTIGIVVFAYLQWKCSDMQRETELFKYRIQHIQDLKAIWEEINQNIEYISGYKANYIIPGNYSNVYNKLFKALDDHLAFTRCYFDTKIYTQEQEFIKLLSGLIPPVFVDATIYHMDINEFDALNEKFKQLCNSYFETIDNKNSYVANRLF